jgi:hypothetical protein
LPLNGYLRTSAPKEISTITVVPKGGGDELRKKRIRRLDGLTKEAQLSIYAYPCESHDPPGGLVPVTLFYWAPLKNNWEELGEAKCCILCYEVVLPPAAGLPRPVVQMKLPEDEPVRKPEREKKADSPQKPKKKVRVQYLGKQIVDFVEEVGSVDSYAIVEKFGVSRSTAVNTLGILVRLGRLSATPGIGRGNRTTYQVKKKAP